MVIIHIFVCLFLIGIVLLQRGKGADIGATFGGSSQTLFGSRGAATFLNKMTTASAIIFMLTSLGLTMLTGKPSSVIKDTGTVEQQAVPVQPATPSQVPDQSQKAPQASPSQSPQQSPAK